MKLCIKYGTGIACHMKESLAGQYFQEFQDCAQINRRIPYKNRNKEKAGAEFVKKERSKMYFSFLRNSEHCVDGFILCRNNFIWVWAKRNDINMSGELNCFTDLNSSHDIFSK